MNLNNIEKVARELFKGNSSVEKNAQLSPSERRAMQQWNTTSHVQQAATATTAKLELLGGWV